MDSLTINEADGGQEGFIDHTLRHLSHNCCYFGFQEDTGLSSSDDNDKWLVSDAPKNCL
jgi:hypothetical protein